MDSRVAVTGIGLVTPLGSDRDECLDRLLAGETAVGPVTGFPSRHLGAEVTGFRPGDVLSARNRRRMDRLSQMAAGAARMAVEDAGLPLDPDHRDRTGVLFGTAFGATDVVAGFARTLFTDGPKSVSPMMVPNIVMNAPAGHTAIELGVRGINATVNHREASAETAIAYAAAEIQRGRADAILAGGADLISPVMLEVLDRFDALAPADGSPAPARPFDRDRRGLVAGEGAGVMVLEPLNRAIERGAPVYGEIAGWGMSAAPAPPTDWPTDPRGPVLAIRRALSAAGIEPDRIDIVMASANGSRRLDRLEADALMDVFGDGSSAPQVTSIKGAVGDSFSSGGIRSALLLMAMARRMAPPTVGLESPIAPLPFVTASQPLNAGDVVHGLVNGFAAGGTFVSLVLRHGGTGGLD